ncbi:hypothetical protein PEL8287_00942 [Roseovarius litorisediminis]|uniref:Succinate dehydrogenase n=1 Tax=Roseovarius litorisediminis TaxID=1312363 RepID=A0A1Y5RNX1_9RHOB|nr:succinate dehydrogenase [Roseovarius litorisediminis]SLN21885.1 hypothetical protein PEL8287_00942 [Roseovarius litorisediminis]
MMRRIVNLILPLALLTGCTAANDEADAVARDRAKSVVNGVVANRFPGVNAAPVTDCVIDAASAGEIIQIAGASVTGMTQSTVEQVVDIASRPDAVQCIAENSLTLLGG